MGQITIREFAKIARTVTTMRKREFLLMSIGTAISQTSSFVNSFFFREAFGSAIDIFFFTIVTTGAVLCFMGLIPWQIRWYRKVKNAKNDDEFFKTGDVWNQ